MAATPFLLGTTDQKLVPSSISDSIWDKVIKTSIISDLTGEEPLIIGDNHFPMVSGRPSASIVGEGEASKGSSIAMGSKTIRPVTAQVIVEVSKNAIAANAGRISDVVEDQLSGAIARQLDLAVFHGRDASTGAAIAGALYANQTENRVTVDFGVKNADNFLWEGYGILVEAGHDFAGLALDPRYIFQLANARDAQGRRLNPEINLGASVGNYNGQLIASSKTVSGQVDASADTRVRGFGGDWGAVKYGIAEEIKLHTQVSGDPLGNGDLEARRMVAVHATVQFGWTILDPTALVAYELAAPAGE